MKIAGLQINLRKIRKADLRILRDWRNTKGIREFNTQYTLLNMIDQKKWYEQIIDKNSDRAMFMVTDKSDHPIGVCGLIHMKKTTRSANIAIILGNQKIHGKGLGSEILQLLVEYGFDNLYLHKITAEVFEYNKISIKLFKKLGFEREVILRESLWRNGKWWDIHVLSLLEKNHKIRSLQSDSKIP